MSKSRDSVVVSVSQSQKGYVCFDKKGCLKAETFDTSGWYIWYVLKHQDIAD